MGFWLADMQFMAGSKGAQEITFNLRGDYIVAVEQAARSTGGAVDAWDAANLPGRSGTQQQFGSPSHLLHRPSLGVLGGHDTRHETRGSCHAAPRPKVRH